MTKKELIKKIDNFMNQALQANCYFSIIKQFGENNETYPEELNLSPAFYSYTFNALIIASFMELFKIYDDHKDSTNIQNLFKNCKTWIKYFPTSQNITYSDMPDKEFSFLWTHTIKECEINFFQEEIDQQRSIRTALSIVNLDIPFSVDMTIERYFELYEWRLTRITPHIENLKKQRSKIYAHNNPTTNNQGRESIIEKYKLYNKDMDALLSFALDFCQFAYAMLTDIWRSTAPANIDDWENTLIMANLGGKYKETEIQKNVDEFKQKITENYSNL